MKKHLFIIIGAVALLFGSCDKAEDPHAGHNHAVITTVRMNFTDQSNQNTFTVEYSDPDGVGGNDPIIDTIFLDSNHVYSVSVEFWNESVNPAEEITPAIEVTGFEHIICYEALNNLMVAFNITDQDSNGQPLGLTSEWTVTTADDGDFKLNLRHQAGVKDGTCTPGESDVEVTFPVVVN